MTSVDGGIEKVAFHGNFSKMYISILKDKSNLITTSITRSFYIFMLRQSGWQITTFTKFYMILHNFTKYLNSTKVSQMVNKCLNGYLPCLFNMSCSAL